MTTSKKKSITSKNASAAIRKGTARSMSDTKYWINKTNWQVFPLGILVALCISTFMNRLGGLGYLSSSPGSVFYEPSTGALLIAVYGLIYICKILFQKTIGTFESFVAYFFAIIAIAAYVFSLTRPAGDPYLVFFILFFNPFTLWLWILLSGLGIVAALVKLKKEA